MANRFGRETMYKYKGKLLESAGRESRRQRREEERKNERQNVPGLGITWPYSRYVYFPSEDQNIFHACGGGVIFNVGRADLPLIVCSGLM